MDKSLFLFLINERGEDGEIFEIDSFYDEFGSVNSAVRAQPIQMR